ncbi:MAG: hypothetical protein J1F01_02415 [Oscillospiraceae bacterium]|nr:hypothetical protein [Oscillospiraceae bacterium]
MAQKAQGATVNIEAIGQTSRIASIGVQLLSRVLNTAFAIGISFAIQGIAKMISASKEMSEQAQRATEEFKEQSSSIDENKKKIEELKNALADNNITYADARDKRSQLLEIQKQLSNKN